MLKFIIGLLLIAAPYSTVFCQSQLRNDAAGLPATDALGRKLPSYKEVGGEKKDKFVGMFYWTWHYAQAMNKPNNTTEFLKQYHKALYNYHDQVWPKNIMNFWAEPLFGYYINMDKWVLYKHAEMLADAGVDMIMFDCTNGDFVWKPAYMQLCEVFAEARKNGIRTPQIAFMMGFGASADTKSAINQVYNDLYKLGLYKDLWFQWKGKPLIMAYPDNVDPEIKDFFTFRPGQPVYDKGPTRKDHWGWLEIYPQHGFVKNSDGSFEQMTVGTSQNWTKATGLSAMNSPGSFGRSYTDRNGQDPRPNAHQYGLNFQEQWDHALKQNVELVFVTGWNEWIAGRYETWQGQHNAFPDQFDVEHSRDIEPMKGGHNDNYYYQLTANIRRFKGMPAPDVSSAAKTMKIDGEFGDWSDVLPEYRSHKGNILHRDADGFSGTHYTNATGRNDLIKAKVAQDAMYVYFYVETGEKLSPATDPRWMRLFIDVDRDKKTGWEGYDFVINRKSPDQKAYLERSLSGWNWKQAAEIEFSYSGKQLEIKVPRTALKIKGRLDLEFKWSDNMQKEGDIMDFLVNGDVAPSGRFNFQYTEADKPLGHASSGADTWVATDGLGRSIDPANYPAKRKDKYAGIFYFIWQGAHGYDTHRGGAPDGGIMAKTAGDTLSPYDITKLLKANPNDPHYGQVHAFHHWGEPYFGYYLPDDEWIIRKHAQMLSDALIDVIILDVTNAAIYLPQVTKIATVYRQMRAAGLTTPSIAFIVNSAPKQTVDKLYTEIYKKGLFSDLWFYWKGKPLLLAPPEGMNEETSNIFSTRQSWAWSKNQQWFGDGKDKWPWLDHYPQSYGWHEAKAQPEQVSVSIAQHPMSNIGRSFHNGKEPKVFSTEQGLYFEEQWKRALEVDPEFVFVTGWNEWVAMRFEDGASRSFLGKSIEKGETYFVDLYNAEFSRDAEPENGVTKDHYYYQMADHIRQFKGVEKPPAFTEERTINIDGKFGEWGKIKAAFRDDQGDTFHRKHPGWGRITEYVNTTGRNDIIEARITSDQRNVYFYVKTAAAMTPRTDEDWMHLLIGVGGSKLTNWEGFQFVANTAVINEKKTTFFHFTKDKHTRKMANIDYRLLNNEMELAIPLQLLGIKGNQFTLDFKWTDHIPLDGDVMQWMDTGDTAPNSRFKYRYVKN